jgi:hypothetical protein
LHFFAVAGADELRAPIGPFDLGKQSEHGLLGTVKFVRKFTQTDLAPAEEQSREQGKHFFRRSGIILFDWHNRYPR